MKKELMALSLTMLGLQLAGGEMKQLSFYNVCFTENELAVDGKLTDTAWDKAPAYSAYYEYWKPNPDTGKLKTSFKMLRSKKGIYLAIINYDQNMCKLKANITNRDNGELWTDDCDEIYFDPSGEGVGYTKFVVNSIGTVGDMRQLDGAVSLNEWSGSGWSAATARNRDSWVVEAFFPWADLGKEAEEGQIWRFCNVRYAYSSGSFVGVTSSPGGNYENTGNFGYIYFGGAAPLDAQVIGEMLSERVSPAWVLPTGDSLVLCDEKGKFRVESVAAFALAEKAKATALAKAVEELLKCLGDDPAKPPAEQALKAMRREAGECVPGNASLEENLNALKTLSRQCAALNEVYWGMKTAELVNSNQSKGGK